MIVKENLLCRRLRKEVLLCATLLTAAPVALYAQGEDGEKNPKLAKLIERRSATQVRVDKAEADRRAADSLLVEGARLNQEGKNELDKLFDDKDQLEKRVFGVDVPAIEKQIKSEDPQERKAGMTKRNEIRKEYNAELKILQARDAEIRRKLKEAEKYEMRGTEKLKLADKALKEAMTALKAIDKEISAIEGAEKTKDREALQSQKKKEEDEAARQKQKEADELKKQQQKEDALAKKEAEKTKHAQEREKVKAKEAEKREKEKAALQKKKEKEAAKREAAKAKKKKNN
jgi:hypothetical protein